jgi:hypothetical protein
MFNVGRSMFDVHLSKQPRTLNPKPMDISIRILAPDDLAIADGIVTSAFGFTDSRAGEIQRYFSLETKPLVSGDLPGSAGGSGGGHELWSLYLSGHDDRSQGVAAQGHRTGIATAHAGLGGGPGDILPAA